MDIICISNPELGHFLKRDQRAGGPAYDIDLGHIFRDILRRIRAFLPSEAGSIFLDNPALARSNRGSGELVLTTSFGASADQLVGVRQPANRGVAGHVYLSGEAHRSNDPLQDPFYLNRVPTRASFPVRSLICAPLKVEGDTIGAIELINHLGGGGFSDADLQLLMIFAETISAAVANAIEAQRSRELAKRDDLTGLYNDRFLHHSLTEIVIQELSQDGECALIFLDLDHFKGVNDLHGHLVGSRVLREVGQTLHQILPGDCVPSRYGGDEFVIVLPGAGPQEVYWVAETIRKNIESAIFLERADPDDPVNYPALRIRGVITCSVGIATLRTDVLPRLPAGPVDPASAKTELIRHADASMYRAKSLGRNRTVSSWNDQPGGSSGGGHG